MTKPPAYLHHAAKWLVATAYMSLEVQGAYQRLLDHEYEDGPLPESEQARAQLIGVTPKRFKAIWKVLRNHFVQTRDGEWVNPFLEGERAAQEEFARSRSGRAANAARARWKDSPEHAAGMLGASPENAGRGKGKDKATTEAGGAARPALEIERLTA